MESVGVGVGERGREVRVVFRVSIWGERGRGGLYDWGAGVWG